MKFLRKFALLLSVAAFTVSSNASEYGYNWYNPMKYWSYMTAGITIDNALKGKYPENINTLIWALENNPQSIASRAYDRWPNTVHTKLFESVVQDAISNLKSNKSSEKVKSTMKSIKEARDALKAFDSLMFYTRVIYQPYFIRKGHHEVRFIYALKESTSYLINFLLENLIKNNSYDQNVKKFLTLEKANLEVALGSNNIPLIQDIAKNINKIIGSKLVINRNNTLGLKEDSHPEQ